MRPHPRIITTIKRGGIIAAALLLLLWIASGWVWCTWVSRSGWVLGANEGCVGGAFIEGHTSQLDNPGWDVHAHPFRMELWFRFIHEPQTVVTFAAPIWVFAVLSLACAACGWWMQAHTRRRARLGLCPKCGYDCAGLAAGTMCPECGGTAANR